MSDNANIPPEYLPPQRESQLVRAINDTNVGFMGLLASDPALNIYAHKNKRHLTNILRACLCSNLTQKLSKLDGIRIRHDKGFFVIEVDDEYGIHIKKLNLDDLLGEIPRTFSNLTSLVKRAVEQMTLPGFTLDKPTKPLSELHIITGTYATNPFGVIINFSLIDRMVEPHTAYNLDLSHSVVDLQENNHVSETVFKTKRPKSPTSNAFEGL